MAFGFILGHVLPHGILVLSNMHGPRVGEEIKSQNKGLLLEEGQKDTANIHSTVNMTLLK